MHSLLMIEVYKYLNGLSPDIVSDICKLRENNYNLRLFHKFESQNPRTKIFGLDSIAYRASHFWKNVPEEIRNSTSPLVFKACVCFFLSNFYFLTNYCPSKTMENVFYFI